MRCHRPGSGNREPGTGILTIFFAAALFASVLGNAVFTAEPLATAIEDPQAKPPAQATPPAQAPSTPQAGYAGSEACATCHTGYDASINASKHGQVKNPRSPAAAQGCETCHGPGEAHMN